MRGGVEGVGEKQAINKSAGSNQTTKYTDYGCSYLAAQRIRTSAVKWPSEPVQIQQGM